MVRRAKVKSAWKLGKVKRTQNESLQDQLLVEDHHNGYDGDHSDSSRDLHTTASTAGKKEIKQDFESSSSSGLDDDSSHVEDVSHPRSANSRIVRKGRRHESAPRGRKSTVSPTYPEQTRTKSRLQRFRGNAGEDEGREEQAATNMRSRRLGRSKRRETPIVDDKTHYYNSHQEFGLYSRYHHTPYMQPPFSYAPVSTFQPAPEQPPSRHFPNSSHALDTSQAFMKLDDNSPFQTASYATAARQRIESRHQTHPIYTLQGSKGAASAPALSSTQPAYSIRSSATTTPLQFAEQRSQYQRAISSELPPANEAHQTLTIPIISEQTTSLLGSEVKSKELIFPVEVQCSHATLNSTFTTFLHQYWPENTAHSDLGDVWVKKAVSSK